MHRNILPNQMGRPLKVNMDTKSKARGALKLGGSNRASESSVSLQGGGLERCRTVQKLLRCWEWTGKSETGAGQLEESSRTQEQLARWVVKLQR